MSGDRSPKWRRRDRPPSADHFPSALSLAQLSQSFFPPVPGILCWGGISLPGPHLLLLWYFSLSLSQWNAGTCGMAGFTSFRAMVFATACRPSPSIIPCIPEQAQALPEQAYGYPNHLVGQYSQNRGIPLFLETTSKQSASVIM